MAESQGLTSVIVVNYNAGPGLLDCLRAALDSSVPVELRVADNASADGSLQHAQPALADDARVQFFANAANLGFAAAANRLLPHCRGDYVLFLNPDCLLQTDTLAHLRAALESHPQAALAGPLVLDPDGREQRSSRRAIPTPARSLVRVLHLHRLFPRRFGLAGVELDRAPLPAEAVALEAVSGACMYVRRAALEAVGPMDESYFLHCEDLDWFMRFRAAGWQILFVPQARVEHAQGTCSKATPLRVLWYKHRGMLKFYRKFFYRDYPRPLFWLVTLSVWARFGLLALWQSWRGGKK